MTDWIDGSPWCSFCCARPCAAVAVAAMLSSIFMISILFQLRAVLSTPHYTCIASTVVCSELVGMNHESYYHVGLVSDVFGFSTTIREYATAPSWKYFSIRDDQLAICFALQGARDLPCPCVLLHYVFWYHLLALHMRFLRAIFKM